MAFSIRKQNKTLSWTLLSASGNACLLMGVVYLVIFHPGGLSKWFLSLLVAPCSSHTYCCPVSFRAWARKMSVESTVWCPQAPPQLCYFPSSLFWSSWWLAAISSSSMLTGTYLLAKPLTSGLLSGVPLLNEAELATHAGFLMWVLTSWSLCALALSEASGWVTSPCPTSEGKWQVVSVVQQFWTCLWFPPPSLPKWIINTSSGFLFHHLLSISSFFLYFSFYEGSNLSPVLFFFQVFF